LVLYKGESSDEEHETNYYDEDNISYRTMNIQGLNPNPTPLIAPRGGTLATLSGMNQYFTIKVPG